MICAVFAIIAEAEQYFSTERLIARSTFFGSSPRPFTVNCMSIFVKTLGSLSARSAVSSQVQGDLRRARTWLVGTALLGATFIAGQVYEFTSFVKEGMGYTTNLAASAFYTLTGFHGVHVTVGIIMLASLVALSASGRLGQDRAETVEIVGLYWHFVDVVWILIFTIVYLIT